MNLFAKLMAERGEERIFAPPIAVGGNHLTYSCTGDAQGVGHLGLAGPVASRLAFRSRDAQQLCPNVPLGVLLRIADADDAMLQVFETRWPGRFVERSLVLGDDCFDVGEPLSQLADEADDF